MSGVVVSAIHDLGLFEIGVGSHGKVWLGAGVSRGPKVVQRSLSVPKKEILQVAVSQNPIGLPGRCGLERNKTAEASFEIKGVPRSVIRPGLIRNRGLHGDVEINRQVAQRWKVYFAQGRAKLLSDGRQVVTIHVR